MVLNLFVSEKCHSLKVYLGYAKPIRREFCKRLRTRFSPSIQHRSSFAKRHEHSGQRPLEFYVIWLTFWDPNRIQSESNQILLQVNTFSIWIEFLFLMAFSNQAWICDGDFNEAAACFQGFRVNAKNYFRFGRAVKIFLVLLACGKAQMWGLEAGHSPGNAQTKKIPAKVANAVFTRCILNPSTVSTCPQ